MSGRFGGALSFDGVNDRVNVNDSASLDLTTAMTLEAWVRPNSLNWRTVLLKERPGGLSYALYSSSNDNRPMAEIAAATGGETRGTASLAAATWSHLATTYDGATVRLFVDGTQVASAAATGTLASSTGALRIGGNAVWGEWFSGLIDEVRVYERALGSAEIQADRDRAVVPGRELMSVSGRLRPCHSRSIRPRRSSPARRSTPSRPASTSPSP